MAFNRLNKSFKSLRVLNFYEYRHTPNNIMFLLRERGLFRPA